MGHLISAILDLKTEPEALKMTLIAAKFNDALRLYKGGSQYLCDCGVYSA